MSSFLFSLVSWDPLVLHWGYIIYDLFCFVLHRAEKNESVHGLDRKLFSSYFWKSLIVVCIFHVNILWFHSFFSLSYDSKLIIFGVWIVCWIKQEIIQYNNHSLSTVEPIFTINFSGTQNGDAPILISGWYWLSWIRYQWQQGWSIQFYAVVLLYTGIFKVF